MGVPPLVRILQGSRISRRRDHPAMRYPVAASAPCSSSLSSRIPSLLSPGLQGTALYPVTVTVVLACVVHASAGRPPCLKGSGVAAAGGGGRPGYGKIPG